MRLTEQHLKAIEQLSLPKSQRATMDEIADMCGVSRTALYKWKQDPIFEEELKRQIVRNNLDDLPDLIAMLPQIAIRDSNAAMAKLALQVNGMLTDRVEVGTTVSNGPDINSLRERIEAAKAAKSDE